MIKKRMSVFHLPMFLLMLLLLTISLNSVVPVLLAFSNQAIVKYIVVEDKSNR